MAKTALNSSTVYAGFSHQKTREYFQSEVFPPLKLILSYSFQFTECSSKEKKDTVANYYIAQSEETLWDISYKCNIPIETLAKLNSHYKRPDSVKEGDRVVLC